MLTIRELLDDNKNDVFLHKPMVSMENEIYDLLESDLECHKISSAIDILVDLHTGVEQICQLMSTNNIVDVNDYSKIDKSLNVILMSIGLECTLPEVHELVNENIIRVAKESIKEKITKIKDFIISLFRKFVSAVSKFFNNLSKGFKKVSEKTSATNEILTNIEDKIISGGIDVKVNFENLVPSGKELDSNVWDNSIDSSFDFANDFANPEVLKNFVDELMGWDFSLVNEDQFIKDIITLGLVIQEAISKQRISVRRKPIKKENKGGMIVEEFEEVLGGATLSFSTHTDVFGKDSTKVHTDLTNVLMLLDEELLSRTGWEIKIPSEKKKSEEVIVVGKIFRRFVQLTESIKLRIFKLEKVVTDMDKQRSVWDKKIDKKLEALYTKAATTEAEEVINSFAGIGKAINKAYKVITEPQMKYLIYFLKTYDKFNNVIQSAIVNAKKEIEKS